MQILRKFVNYWYWRLPVVAYSSPPFSWARSWVSRHQSLPVMPPASWKSENKELCLTEVVESKDILLTEMDLPPSNPKYLVEMTVEDYNTECGNGDSGNFIWKRYIDDDLARLGILLPLHTKRGTIIPVPWIIDTGAPMMLYLGKEAFNQLDKLHYIGYGIYGSAFTGEIKYKNMTLKKPRVELLPTRYELLTDGKGDVRTNVIGMAGLSRLKILEDYKNLLKLHVMK